MTWAARWKAAAKQHRTLSRHWESKSDSQFEARAISKMARLAWLALGVMIGWGIATWH